MGGRSGGGVLVNAAPFVELINSLFHGSKGSQEEIIQKIKLAALANEDPTVYGGSPAFKESVFNAISKKKSGPLNFWSPDRYLINAPGGGKISTTGLIYEPPNFAKGEDYFLGPPAKTPSELDVAKTEHYRAQAKKAGLPPPTRPWAPTSKEEFKEVHPPQVRGWAPGSKEEYQEVHPPQVRNWGPMSKEEYKEVHPPTPSRRTDQEELDLYKGKKQIESEFKPPEKAPELTGSDVKVLRAELLKLYLTDPKVWGDAYETAKSAAQYGRWDEVYAILDGRQQQVFEKMVAEAHPLSKKLGPIEALRKVLGWGLGQPSVIDNKPSPSTNQPPQIRETPSQSSTIVYDKQGNRVK